MKSASTTDIGVNTDEECLEAVSYTHLDVYKRQEGTLTVISFPQGFPL